MEVLHGRTKRGVKALLRPSLLSRIVDLPVGTAVEGRRDGMGSVCWTAGPQPGMSDFDRHDAAHYGIMVEPDDVESAK